MGARWVHVIGLGEEKVRAASRALRLLSLVHPSIFLLLGYHDVDDFLDQQHSGPAAAWFHN